MAPRVFLIEAQGPPPETSSCVTQRDEKNVPGWLGLPRDVYVYALSVIL